jgi:endonuclease/exonuclease/phosphatase family metal-dependent hydrolase
MVEIFIYRYVSILHAALLPVPPYSVAQRAKDGVKVAVSSLHLEPFAGSRAKRAEQSASVQKNLEQLAATYKPCFTIAAGDMNMTRSETCPIPMRDALEGISEADAQWSHSSPTLVPL